MPIENRNLKPGTHLVGRYHKQSYSCEVIEGEGSKLRYRLIDGREFKSPSAAGMAITGHACDGWVFWSIDTAAVTTEVQQESSQKVVAPTPPVTESSPTSFFRTPNQKGVPEGKTRWYCHDCGKSFLAPESDMPKACPQGHKAA